MKKLGALILGAILTIGIGAGISVKPATDVAKADSASITLANGSYGEDAITWTIPGITVSQNKGTGSSAVNKSYIAAPRMYKGHYLQFTCDTGYAINSITLSYTGSYYGNSITAGTQIVDNVVTDDTTAITKNLASTSGGSHLFTCTNALSSLYIQNVATTNVQLRLTGISIDYNKSADAVTLDSIEITSNPTKTSYTAGETLDLTGLTVQANWSNGNSTDVSDTISTSPAEGDVLLEDTEVVITYQDKTTSFNVTVAAAQISETDKILTAGKLGLVSSYSANDLSLENVIYGRQDVMMNSTGKTIQFKKNTGKLYNKNAMPTNIKSIVIAFDADNSYAPSNYAVYAGTTAGDTSNKISAVAIDETNYVYSFDFSGGEYKYFTFAKTGDFATYIDMLVVELDSTIANSVRSAAKLINDTLAEECAALNVKESTWATLEASIADEDVISALNETILNTALSKSGDSVQLTEAQKALSKYDYIVAKYGYNNFLSRDVAQTGRISLINDNNSLMVIAFIITAVAVGAVAMLVIRKRKYSK